MKAQPISRLPDADMQAAPAGLLRAARRAREIARQTGTAVVVVRDGKLVEDREAALSWLPQSRNRADRGMALTDINSEDRLVQQTVAEHLEKVLGWESVYAFKAETFGPNGTLGRASERDIVLLRHLRAALTRLNPDIPESAREQASEKLTRIDFARSLIQHNREFYGFIRGGVPVEWRDAFGDTRYARARVIDFGNVANNRFLAVRELRVQGVRVPHYNRRADLVCFVNGLPLVFIELKAYQRHGGIFL